jgi:hypothetical protein
MVDFSIDGPTAKRHFWLLTRDNGSCRPAEETEIAMWDEIARLRAALDEALEVVKPFAKEAENISKSHLDGHVTDDNTMFVAVGHLRGARRFYEKHKGGER